MGGRIAAASPIYDGRGTRILISLPKEKAHPALAAMSAYRPRILVIDDEPQIHRFLGPALDAAGFEAAARRHGAEGLRAIAPRSPDAVVLDLGLPDMDGKDLLKRRARLLRRPGDRALGARPGDAEKIDTLDLGADDYVEKPFGVGELLARLRVAMRHKLERAGAEAVVQAGDLEIDLVKRLVSRAGEPVRLSPKEYDLLARLAEGDGKVLTHRQLLTAVWGPAHVDDVPYLRVLVGQLRQKLEAEPASPASTSSPSPASATASCGECSSPMRIEIPPVPAKPEPRQDCAGVALRPSECGGSSLAGSRDASR